MIIARYRQIFPQQFLLMYVDDVAKAGGIPSRRTSGVDDETPPSPMTIEIEPSPIDPQFTSPQPMHPSQSVTPSPIVPRPSPQSSSPSITTGRPSPAAQSPGNGYHSPSPGHPIHSNSPYNLYSSITSPGMSPLPGGSQVIKFRQTPPMGAQAPKYPPTPPRPLVARAWASSTPTILSHGAFSKLCSPVVGGGRMQPGLCPLEMFLGSMFLKKHFYRAIQGDKLIEQAKSDSSRVTFKVNTLQCRVSVEQSSLMSLRFNVSPVQGQDSTWTHDELRILERFFETRVACPPYKANSVTAFVRILTATPNILKDLIKIIRLELNPDPSHKWRVLWCLSIPPSAPDVAPPGTPAVVLRAKIFIFIQLKRMNPSGAKQEECSVYLPLLYDPQTNLTQQVDISRQGSETTSPSSAAITLYLRRWNESPASKTGECTIFPAVLELAKNLVLPT